MGSYIFVQVNNIVVYITNDAHPYIYNIWTLNVRNRWSRPSNENIMSSSFRVQSYNNDGFFTSVQLLPYNLIFMLPKWWRFGRQTRICKYYFDDSVSFTWQLHIYLYIYIYLTITIIFIYIYKYIYTKIGFNARPIYHKCKPLICTWKWTKNKQWSTYTYIQTFSRKMLKFMIMIHSKNFYEVKHSINNTPPCCFKDNISTLHK